MRVELLLLVHDTLRGMGRSKGGSGVGIVDLPHN